MLKIIKTRIKQGYQTLDFPPTKKMPERFRGLPVINPNGCGNGCNLCREACPVGAITTSPLTLDLGKCIFCEECVAVCPSEAITYSQNLSTSALNREDLVLKGQNFRFAKTTNDKIKKIFGRSLKLRVVTAGSCNGCDLEINASNNIQFDISRFGINYVASPRHADGLIVTGAVSENMKLALEKTYNALCSPKIVIALGSCAISGGPFKGSQEVHNGASSIIPVDLFVAGCPPHPMTIIDAIVRLLEKI
jgi:Ni,Fe-hydrogenase III small subunit/formate hydrogenlyase subunit 6/NADH:ubiquinone oxidoreductase subunit I